jgi:hypothetical protein
MKFLTAFFATLVASQAWAALPPTIMDQVEGAYDCPIPNTSFKNKMSITKKDGKFYFNEFSGDVKRITKDGISCDGFDTINAIKTEQTDADGSIKKTTDVCTVNSISRNTEETPSKSKDKYVNSISVTKTAAGVTIVSKITDQDQNGKWISIPPITFPCVKSP